ncbi:MAG TPA: ABC transporter ATP-binding protein [Patescibacteria group bacterium]|nr:ABC transporter ATP-binding protein [Gammaproteobacteria bacterium]HWA51464.1 ABC transporter ATP-binding protein [Patescibacteria group bacterium]
MDFQKTHELKTENLLTVKNLTIRFSTTSEEFVAVDNASFSLRRGETLALVGESGSGKSLTALAILQLLPGNARMTMHSQIFLAGQKTLNAPIQDLLSLPEVALRKIRGRRVGIIFQEASTALNPVLTIGEQINEVLRRHFKLPRGVRRQRMLTLLAKVGITDPVRCSASYSYELSGGQRQRAMIAMALAGEPDLLIADEPTTALDVTLQAQVLQLLREIQRNTGMGLLFITHDLGIVYQIADQVAVIHAGKIVEQASVATFFKAPQHPYSRRLFAALPSWENRVDKNVFLTAEKANPLLSIHSLKVYFPIKKGIFQRTVDYVKAVQDVSFNVRGAETFALVGESGCGKTTIAKAVSRLVQPMAGQVMFLNQDLVHLQHASLNQLRGDLQMIFQDPYASMDPRMHIGGIIAEGMLARKMASSLAECYPVIRELLQRVGLAPDCIERFPHEFSGGQRQRICIARALAMRPKLIICDEPTSALDVVVQMDILKLLQSLQQELGLSYLLITHNFAVVAYLAHHVAVMHQGRIIEQGGVEQVLFQPKEDYTRQLLAAVPRVGSVI